MKLSACVPANLNLFQIWPKTVAFAMHLLALLMLNVMAVSVIKDNAQLHAETLMIVRTVNIV
jgi:hypothetical protein